VVADLAAPTPRVPTAQEIAQVMAEEIGRLRGVRKRRGVWRREVFICVAVDVWAEPAHPTPRRSHP